MKNIGKKQEFQGRKALGLLFFLDEIFKQNIIIINNH